MTKQFYKDALGWGFILWLIGYVLGIMIFSIVPVSMIGWILMPVGTVMMLWVLFKKTSAAPLRVLTERPAFPPKLPIPKITPRPKYSNKPKPTSAKMYIKIFRTFDFCGPIVDIGIVVIN